MDGNLLILGAGQYSYVVEDIAVSLGCFEKISFLDDNSGRAIGKIDSFDRFKDEFKYAVVAIGNPTIKAELFERLTGAGFELPNLIHKSAYVSPQAELGVGNIIEPNASVQANSVLGDGCIVSSGAVVRHNATVGSFAHCDCNSVVMSGANVPNGTKVKCLEFFVD